jgi:hypothetical protein
MVMVEGTQPERAELQFVLHNRRPVDVTDLGQSLQAFGREYEEFVLDHGYEIPPVNARLLTPQGPPLSSGSPRTYFERQRRHGCDCRGT